MVSVVPRTVISAVARGTGSPPAVGMISVCCGPTVWGAVIRTGWAQAVRGEAKRESKAKPYRRQVFERCITQLLFGWQGMDSVKFLMISVAVISICSSHLLSEILMNSNAA
jgi:hypothetical protein